MSFRIFEILERGNIFKTKISLSSLFYKLNCPYIDRKYNFFYEKIGKTGVSATYIVEGYVYTVIIAENLP